MALTAGHMGTCWAVFAALRRTGLKGRLMPDVDMEISWEDYLRAVVPIAVLNACGLALSNFAVKLASVAFLQIIKPANLIWGSVFAFLFRVEPTTLTHVIIVLVVISGVSLASHSNAEFSREGFVLQLMATATEGSKLVLIQRVTSKRLKLDPLTTVYRYAPLAFTCLAILSSALEGTAVFERLRSSKVLVSLNCLAAVILNVLIVGTISRTSAVVFILAGVVKDIGTIAASVIVFRSVVGWNQIVGFGLSLVGIMMYKAYKQHLDSFVAQGFLGGFKVALGLQAPAAAIPSSGGGNSSNHISNRSSSSHDKVRQESDDEEMALIGRPMDDDDDDEDK